MKIRSRNTRILTNPKTLNHSETPLNIRVSWHLARSISYLKQDTINRGEKDADTFLSVVFSY
jgi:hypothetical protein